MKTTKFLSGIGTLIVLFTFLSSCKKDKVSCSSPTELTGQNHLVDLQALNQAGEFGDTLAKYPQLQVYRVVNDQYTLGMHCRVFYNGLPVFSDHYSLIKSKSTNELFAPDSVIVDNLSISLSPALSYSNAIDLAKQQQDFSKTCISYRLGIFDIHSGKGMETTDYKLVWKVQGQNEVPYVILDANSGQVYRQHDGMVN